MPYISTDIFPDVVISDMFFGHLITDTMGLAYNRNLVKTILRPYQKVFEKQEAYRIEYGEPCKELTKKLVEYLKLWIASYNSTMNMISMIT